jgi:hypothetical protein
MRSPWGTGEEPFSLMSGQPQLSVTQQEPVIALHKVVRSITLVAVSTSDPTPSLETSAQDLVALA